MSALGDIFKEANVSNEKIKNIVEMLKENPLSAMTAVQELNMGDDAMGKIMGVVMSNPNAIDELAEEVGLSKEDLAQIKDKMQNPAT